MSSPTVLLGGAAESKQPAQTSTGTMLKYGLLGLTSLVVLYGILSLYMAGETMFAVMILAILIGFVLVFGSRRYYTARFLFPAIVTMGLFMVFPLIYTAYVGFTNYSGTNLLNFVRVKEIHLSQTAVDKSTERPFALVADGGEYRIFMREGDGGLLSDPFPADGAPASVRMMAVTEAPASTLPMRDQVKMRDQLKEVTAILPDGSELTSSGIRTMAKVQSLYQDIGDDRLQRLDGTVLVPDHEAGFYVTEAGDKIAPGWRVNVGWDNFKRVLTSEGMRGPMLKIFIWTVVFAALSTLGTFSVGTLLAVILQWEHLRFRSLYRILLILPYAVPGFISILVFRGLFNQNFGEINMILESVMGIRPEWFTDPTLARVMTLIVNIWLGYPYMMLLAMGYLQSVPDDHSKAAALEGASPVRCFFGITLPQILPPFMPMLISTFAFNFNNVVLILLLTRGLPDIPGTLIPAGSTDILGSFTYRISFMDSGQNFGLAGAIASMIFIVVGLMAYANFVALRRAAAAKGK